MIQCLGATVWSWHTLSTATAHLTSGPERASLHIGSINFVFRFFQSHITSLFLRWKKIDLILAELTMLMLYLGAAAAHRHRLKGNAPSNSELSTWIPTIRPTKLDLKVGKEKGKKACILLSLYPRSIRSLRTVGIKKGGKRNLRKSSCGAKGSKKRGYKGFKRHVWYRIFILNSQKLV